MRGHPSPNLSAFIFSLLFLFWHAWWRVCVCARDQSPTNRSEFRRARNDLTTHRNINLLVHFHASDKRLSAFIHTHSLIAPGLSVESGRKAHTLFPHASFSINILKQTLGWCCCWFVFLDTSLFIIFFFHCWNLSKHAPTRTEIHDRALKAIEQTNVRCEMIWDRQIDCDDDNNDDRTKRQRGRRRSEKNHTKNVIPFIFSCCFVWFSCIVFGYVLKHT